MKTINSQQVIEHNGLYPNFILAIEEHPMSGKNILIIQTYVRYRFNELYKLKRFQGKITMTYDVSFILNVGDKINKLLKEAGDFKENGYSDYIDETQID